MQPEMWQAGPYGVIGLVFLYLVRRLNKVEARVDRTEIQSRILRDTFNTVFVWFTLTWHALQDAADKNEVGDILSPPEILTIRRMNGPDRVDLGTNDVPRIKKSNV
jgi:hypothetical protein